ncbi:MAG: 50S ribosomal protein L32 [Clostridium sp.]|jgi:large subunit ribosomal protein L32|nr:50S ribosomal protein L32 [Clostridium sp.]
MANPKRKTSKGRRDRRRAQTFTLAAPSIVECPNCHDMKLSHRVCKNCGHYDGEAIIAKVDAE